MLVWDLSLVLSALPNPLLEPAETSDLRVLLFKMALLLAFTCRKQVGDLQTLSVNIACMQFGPNYCIVRLMPRHGYTPKVLSTLFRAQVIKLQADSHVSSEELRKAIQCQNRDCSAG